MLYNYNTVVMGCKIASQQFCETILTLGRSYALACCAVALSSESQELIFLEAYFNQTNKQASLTNVIFTIVLRFVVQTITDWVSRLIYYDIVGCLLDGNMSGISTLQEFL